MYVIARVAVLALMLVLGSAVAHAAACSSMGDAGTLFQSDDAGTESPATGEDVEEEEEEEPDCD